jgi:AcrR family transcriptional regulator
VTGPRRGAASNQPAAPSDRPARRARKAATDRQPDGRTARALRTREAIIDAVLAFNGEGELRASAERIVERAGVSLRTLWTNFKDLDGLYAAVDVRLVARQAEQARPIPPDDPLDKRIIAYCRQRATMLEIVSPAARASVVRLPYSAMLRENFGRHYARVREEIDTVFRAELAAAGAQREELARAILVNSTWPAWAMMRDDMGLDLPTSVAVMTRAVGAVLTRSTG